MNLNDGIDWDATGISITPSRHSDRNEGDRRPNTANQLLQHSWRMDSLQLRYVPQVGSSRERERSFRC